MVVASHARRDNDLDICSTWVHTVGFSCAIDGIDFDLVSCLFFGFGVFEVERLMLGIWRLVHGKAMVSARA